MKLFPILAVLLASATPATARNIMNFECGKVTVDIVFVAPHKTNLGYDSHEITITGLRDPIKDRVSFKLVPSEDGVRVFKAYLNGKACKEIPYNPTPDDLKTTRTNSLRSAANQTLFEIQGFFRNSVPSEVMPLLLRLREAITKAESQSANQNSP